jgi:hypothetical protein
VREGIPVEVKPEASCKIRVHITADAAGFPTFEPRCYLILSHCGAVGIGQSYEVLVGMRRPGVLEGALTLDELAATCVRNGQRTPAKFEIQFERDETYKFNLDCAYKFEYTPYSGQPNR